MSKRPDLFRFYWGSFGGLATGLEPCFVQCNLGTFIPTISHYYREALLQKRWTPSPYLSMPRLPMDIPCRGLLETTPASPLPQCCLHGTAWDDSCIRLSAWNFHGQNVGCLEGNVSKSMVCEACSVPVGYLTMCSKGLGIMEGLLGSFTPIGGRHPPTP